jgi:hypothetical protein
MLVSGRGAIAASCCAGESGRRLIVSDPNWQAAIDNRRAQLLFEPVELFLRTRENPGSAAGKGLASSHRFNMWFADKNEAGQRHVIPVPEPAQRSGDPVRQDSRRSQQ